MVLFWVKKIKDWFIKFLTSVQPLWKDSKVLWHAKCAAHSRTQILHLFEAVNIEGKFQVTRKTTAWSLGKATWSLSGSTCRYVLRLRDSKELVNNQNFALKRCFEQENLF